MAVLPVVIDSKGAVVGAGVYNRAQASMQKSTMASQRVMKSLLGTMAAFAAIRSVTNSIAEFELTMRKVQGVTNQTDKQMQAMIKTARELGATTQFSAREAGEGFLFLSRAGFTAAEATAAIPATLNLAAAGGLALGEAADLASNILSQFNINASETVRVVDALIRVSNQANTDVQQLGQAFKFAGPIAGALGKTVEETAVLIGFLGDSGIQASMAGTNLRGVMLALSAPTSSAQKVIKELGLTVEELNPQTNKVSDIFGKFEKAGLGATEAATIFGTRNAAAGLILARSADQIDETVTSLEDMRSAGDNAGLIMDTLSGAMKEFASAVDEAKLALGDAGLGKAIRFIVEFGTDVIRTLSGIDGELKNNETVIKSVVFLIEVMAVRWALLTASRVLFWLEGVVRTLILSTRAMLAFNSAVASNPIGLLAIAFSAVIVLIADFVSGIDKSQKKLTELSDAAKLFAKDTGRGIFINNFDARIKQQDDLFSAAAQTLKRLQALQKEGETAVPESIVKDLDLPTRRTMVGGEIVNVVRIKTAINAMENLQDKIRSNIAFIELDQLAWERNEKAIAGRNKETKKAIDVEKERAETIQEAIDALDAETKEIEFQTSLVGRSAVNVALLTLQKQKLATWAKISEGAHEAEGTAFMDAAARLRLATVDFEKAMQKQVNALGKKTEAERLANQESETFSQASVQAITQTVDGLIDIAANSDNAAEAIKRLVLEISKLLIKEQILNVIRRGQAAAASTTSTTAPVTQERGALGLALDSGRVVNRFAIGGRLISTPTAVPVGMNLLGEGSDQEFVLPAARGADGKLGVRLSGISGGGGGGGSSTDNRRQNVTMNFFDKARDVDSFKRSAPSIKRDMKDQLRN